MTLLLSATLGNDGSVQESMMGYATGNRLRANQRRLGLERRLQYRSYSKMRDSETQRNTQSVIWKMGKGDKKRIGLLFSGGKDSTYACSKMLEQGHDVECLVTVISSNKSSYMLHTADIELTQLSSEALEIPLVKGYTEGKKEEELGDIKKAILSSKDEYGIDAIGTGAIASRYQKERIDSIASECGLSVISPLWQINQDEYMRALQSEGFQYIITSVSSEGLGREWLGREVSESDLSELIRLSQKFKFNVAFEGGEAETFVLDCPIFKSKRIKILEASIKWNGYYGEYEIRKATLENKKLVCDKRV